MHSENNLFAGCGAGGAGPSGYSQHAGASGSSESTSYKEVGENSTQATEDCAGPSGSSDSASRASSAIHASVAELTEEDLKELKDFHNVLLCPVCMIRFSGKILQCINGHDVCESCKEHIDICPLCRKRFGIGRNYALEHIAKLVKEHHSYHVTSTVPAELNSTDHATVPRSLPAHSTQHSIYHRPNQQFRCGILHCKEKYPFYVLLNHLRLNHPFNFVFVSNDEMQKPAYKTVFTMPFVSNSKAFHLAKYGLCFLTIIVKRSSLGKIIVKGWLQAAENPELLWYRLYIRLKQIKLIFNDLCFGVNTVPEKIIRMGNCLYYAGPELSPSPTMTVRLKIAPNAGLVKHQSRTRTVKIS